MTDHTIIVTVDLYYMTLYHTASQYIHTNVNHNINNMAYRILFVSCHVIINNMK